MKTSYDILIRPIITEKALEMTKSKKYTFEVLDGSTKPEIAKAVEEAFGVKVAKVNTISVKKKKRTVGVHQGYKKAWTKAIVTLKEDSKTIAFFDGMI